ncbi:hypothetical protein V5H08_02130 [Vibrio cholerae]|uniref:hypothetical protein n=1 Tax=Vibrio cholerae TaxID=666 RepID=UPI003966D2A4|nr:hypothetical protein [Vibrio cholerae]
MKLEKAYSLDLKKDISASDADGRYKRVISSKFAFKCPGKSCEAQVTCANLDKPKYKRKREPYYKIVGDHCESCEIQKDIEPSKRRRAIEDDIYSDADEYIDNAVRLDVSPPSVKRPDVQEPADPSQSDDIKTRRPATPEDGKRKIQPSRRLSSLVSAFLNNEPMTIQVPGEGIMSIKDFFVAVDGQDIQVFEDYFRVYYGKAWINKNDKGYIIRFNNQLKFGSLEVRPSFFIPAKMVDESSYRKFQSATLDKLANKYLKDIYILCETGPTQKGEYINFWLDGLEYLEYQF